MSLQDFHYLHIDNGSPVTLVLLHGTGGDEHDLLPLAENIPGQLNILSIRGNILENGMSRFFKRKSFGVFDEENVRYEAKKLHSFITSFSQSAHCQVSQLLYLGFSNGANMILALLLLYPDIVTNAILLHPMIPLQDVLPDLHNKHIAVTYGESDPMITPDQSKLVIKTLKLLNANVYEFSHASGHIVPAEELSFISDTVRKITK